MLLVYYIRNLIDGVYRLKIVTRSMSQLCHLKTFFELTINYILFYEMIMHNSLIQAPNEMIQDAMERQEKALQLSCFEF